MLRKNKDSLTLKLNQSIKKKLKINAKSERRTLKNKVIYMIDSGLQVFEDGFKT